MPNYRELGSANLQASQLSAGHFGACVRALETIAHACVICRSRECAHISSLVHSWAHAVHWISRCILLHHFAGCTCYIPILILSNKRSSSLRE